MNIKKYVIALIIFLMVLNIFLYINYQKATEQLDMLLKASVQDLRVDLWHIDSMELPTREALDKEHLNIIIAVLNRAIAHSGTISKLIDQNNIEIFILDMNQDIWNIYTNSKQHTPITESDYDKYLEFRGKISTLHSLFKSEKYMNLSIKNIEDLRNDFDSSYMEYR